MQIAVFGSKKKPGNEKEKEDAREIGRCLAKNGMGPLLANVDSSLAREAALGAREQSDRMIIIGTLPTERNSDHTEITFSERPYSATYFTNITNKIRSCSAAIFIGNGPDVLEALVIAYNHAPEGFVIGIFNNASGLSKKLLESLAEKRDKKPCAVIHTDHPTLLVSAVFAEVMRSHAKTKNAITEQQNDKTQQTATQKGR